MSSTDNATLTNKSFNNNNNKTNKDTNKQLIQDIIKVSNKAIDSIPVEYIVDTENNRYYCYDGLYYDDNHVEFTDEYDDKINLSYEDIIGIRVSEIQYVVQCVTEDEKVKDSVAEIVPLSYLLITLATTNSYLTRVPYSNNINNHINVIIITYTTHTVSLILSYLSASYVNNSIYFTILTTAIDTITDTYTSSNVLLSNLLML